MELVILCGIQCSGKSTLYEKKFSKTHARVNLDSLGTRDDEFRMFRSLVADQKSMVIDNTNPTASDRSRYIEAAKVAGYRIVGYQFNVPINVAIARSLKRRTQAPIPPSAIHLTAKRFQSLSISEGFDEIVNLGSKGEVLSNLTLAKQP